MDKKAAVLGFAASLVAAACATSGGGLKPIERKEQFPSREQLAQIQAEPAPQPSLQRVERAIVAEWQLAGPLPNQIGPVPRTPEDELDELAASFAARRDGVEATEAMRCVAREVGLFYLEHFADPEQELQRFMEHRCGTSSSYVLAAKLYWEEGAGAQWGQANHDGTATTRLDGHLADMLGTQEHAEVGGWFGSNDKMAAAVVVVGFQRLHLEPMPMTVVEDGEFDVRGHFFDKDVDIVTALVNQGAYEAARCWPLLAELPEFHLRCKAQKTDTQAGFEIYTQREGDLIASSRLWQRVWPSGNPATKYVRHGQPVSEPAAEAAAPAPEVAEGEGTEKRPVDDNPAEPRPVAEHEEFDTSPQAIAKRVVELVNERRAEARLKPVTLAEKQSASAHALAPHYFDAQQVDNRKREEIMFGLLAGWEVRGSIIDGSFYSIAMWGGPRQIVNDLTARPGARDLVFGPDVATLSVGARYHEGSKTLGAMIHGWRFVPDDTHAQRVDRFLDFLAKSRRARGSKPPKKEASLEGYADKLAEQLSAGEIELHVAAYRAMNRATASYQMDTRVWYFEAHDPTEIVLPPEVLDTEPLRVMVVIAPYKPPKSPWSTYGVIIAFPQYESETKLAERVPTPSIPEAADDASDSRGGLRQLPSGRGGAEAQAYRPLGVRAVEAHRD